ncbi:hypothetical protein MK852_19425 [Shewanella benthica]|nr:hypothetical protein [Shewanella benthica]
MSKDNSCPGHHTIVSSPSAGKSVFMAKQTWELMRGTHSHSLNFINAGYARGGEIWILDSGFNSQTLNCRQPKRPTNETA